MIGMLLGIFKNFFWIGYSIIESLIFMWVFNAIALDLTVWGLWLPVTTITWGTSLSIFLLIGFIGKFIQTLVPTIIKIDNSSKSEK